MAQNPSYDDIRNLINQVMDTATRTSVPAQSKPPAKGAKMAEPMMKEDGPKAEMPPVKEENTAEMAKKPAAKPAAKAMTAAELAEKVGMSEEELTKFLEQSGLLESAGGMDGLLAALSANPAMVDELAGLIKTTKGQSNDNKVPMV